MNKRDEAIKKIISAIYGDDTYEKIASSGQAESVDSTEDNELYQKLNTASAMLKSASHQIQNFELENRQLQEKIAMLETQLNTIERRDDAEKLASMMLAKGMIKKADYNKQIDTIMKFDKEGFEIFKDAIENVSLDKTASIGVGTLDFLYGEDNADSLEPKKKTMFDTLDEKCNN